jgi:predicted small metal-binding protein
VYFARFTARSFTQAPWLLSYEEIIMTRKYIDCREFPSEMNCSVALSADSENELLEAAVQHAVTVHKHADSPELRSQLKTLFHDGTPPAEAPRHA